MATKKEKPKTKLAGATVKSRVKLKVEVKAKVKKEIVKKPPKTPKIKVEKKKISAKKPTAQVGTINLKGKEAEILKKYQHGKQDTGSTEVQIALFTAKINSLSKHLKKHGKDSDSKRGLLIMVGKRRRLLNYLAKSNPLQYEKLIGDLGLRK